MQQHLTTLFFCLTLATCVFQSRATYAQDFGSTGSTWHYSIPSFANSGVDYTEIESIGDVQVNEHTCHHLQKTHGFDCSFAGDDIFIFEDSGIVYYFIPELQQFSVLYNFNLQEGDIQKAFGYGFLGLDSFAFRVTSVGYETINDRTLKRFSLEYLPPYTRLDEVIEGIGSTFYLYPQLVICDPEPRGLRCYQDSQFGFYSTHIAPSCDFKMQSITIFPNPTTSSVAINFDVESFSSEGLQIDFLNVLGKIQFQKELSTERILDLSSYPAGIYFLKVKQEGGEQVIKIVKE